MPSPIDIPELAGFFGYSREDDQGSRGGLSALRDGIQTELSAQAASTLRRKHVWRMRHQNMMPSPVGVRRHRQQPEQPHLWPEQCLRRKDRRLLYHYRLELVAVMGVQVFRKTVTRYYRALSDLPDELMTGAATYVVQ